MRPERIHRLVACMAAVLIAACSKPEPPAAATASPAAAVKLHRKACDLVTAAEMSVILGTTVVATPNEPSKMHSVCAYVPSGGESGPAVGPAVGLSIELGAGPASMAAAGLALANSPAGMVDPLQGVGEQAVHVQAGQMVVINTGDDLMEIDYANVADPLPMARRIYEIARPRM
jgi:hypothetical protein